MERRTRWLEMTAEGMKNGCLLFCIFICFINVLNEVIRITLLEKIFNDSQDEHTCRRSGQVRVVSSCEPSDTVAQQLLTAASIMCQFCAWYWGGGYRLTNTDESLGYDSLYI